MEPPDPTGFFWDSKQRPMDSLTVRSFIAVPLPEGVQNSLGTIQKRFQIHPGISASFPKSAGLHITLCFLGECSVDILKQVKSVMVMAMTDIPSFDLRVSGLGVFPQNRRFARILWAGVSGEIFVLTKIYRQLKERLASVGFPEGTAKFFPHITIARFKATPQTRLLERSMAEEKFSKEKNLAFQVTGITLYRSVLTARGANYSSLHTSRCQA